MNDELELVDGGAPDDDPEVVAGMNRLRELRAREAEIPELRQALTTKRPRPPLREE